VLWQTGAVEAARNLDLDELAAALDTGLDRVDAAGADAVLIDPQFSRFLRANANVEPYREAMRLAAAAHNAPLVRRYDLMHAWAEADKVDLERAPRSARVAVADRLNDCLAQAVAEVLARGVEEAKTQRPP
jgi:acyl-CoA thioesterase I